MKKKEEKEELQKTRLAAAVRQLLHEKKRQPWLAERRKKSGICMGWRLHCLAAWCSNCGLGVAMATSIAFLRRPAGVAPFEWLFQSVTESPRGPKNGIYKHLIVC
jgi:hypothetical protein